jgi:hypothetical protein
MGKLRIPKQYESGFGLLQRLDDSSYRSFLQALNSFPTSLREDIAFQKIADQVPGLDLFSTREIMLSIAPLSRLQRERGDSKQFVQEVIKALEVNGSKAIDLTNAEVLEGFVHRLSEVLDARGFQHWTKANELLHQHGRLLHDIQVFSDIRPIFESPEDGPSGAVIVHTLKLTCSESGVIKDFYVALDGQDIIEVIDAMIRASKKADSLREFLAGTNIPTYDLE